MHRETEQQHAFLELWDTFLRHKARFVIPAFLVAAIVLSVGFIIPRKYRATAIFERRTDVVLTEMSSRGATRSFSDPRQSQREQLIGQPAIEQLLREIEPVLYERGLVRNAGDLQQLRETLRRHVVVHLDIATADLDRARIEYVAASPELAKLVVNGLVNNYIERTREAMERRLRDSANFFRSEVESHRLTIESLENRILEFEIANSELLPHTPNNIHDRLSGVQDALASVIAMRDGAAMRVQALQQTLAETAEYTPTVVRGRNPELDRLEAQLRDARRQLQQFVSELKMTEAHPDVVSVKQQIATTQAAIAQTDQEIVTHRQMAVNPRRAEVSQQLTEAIAQHRAYAEQASSLRAQSEEFAAATARMFEVRSTHRKMTRDLAEAQRQLNFWEDNLRRIDLSLAAETGNRGVQLEFLQPAYASRRPVSPALPQLLMAAFMLAMLSGSLSVFLAHRNDQTFSSGDELARATSLPLFGAVSELVSQRHRRLRRLRHATLYPAAGVAMASVLVAVAIGLYADLEDPDAMATLRAKARQVLEAMPGARSAHATPPAGTFATPAEAEPVAPADALETADTAVAPPQTDTPE
jgi:uncharacterized protein involved in exopolysaccharide biosynthesis